MIDQGFGILAAALLLAAMTFARAEYPQPQPQQHLTCTLEAGPTRSVVRVIDAETVLLDDDQEVRLIGALALSQGDAYVLYILVALTVALTRISNDAKGRAS